MKSKTVLLPLLAVALAAAVYVLWQAEGGPRIDTARAAPADATAGDSAVPATLQSAGPAASSTAGTEPATERRRVATARSTITGRCVDAATGAALSGCVVELRARRKSTEHAEDPSWRDPEPVTTGSGGGFEFAFTAPADYRVDLRAERHDRATVRQSWWVFDPDAHLDLGDVPMPPGGELAGRVVDTRGAAVAGVAVSLRYLGEEPDGALAPRTTLTRTSDGAGSVGIDERLLAGRWSLAVRSEYVVECPEQIEVLAGTRIEFHVVVHAAGDLPELSGTVVDQFGEPVPGVEVVGSVAAERSKVAAPTDAGGVFVLRRPPATPAGPVRLAVPDPEGYQRLLDAGEFEWGTRGVELSLVRGPSLEILVVDAVTGRPIERFGVRCIPRQRITERRRNHIRVHGRGEHPGGRMRIPALSPGSYTLIVLPADRAAYGSVGIARFEAEAGRDQHQRVEIQPVVAQTLRVVTAHGEPVAGAEVVLAEPLDVPQMTLQTFVFPAEESYVRAMDPQAMLVQQGETDADGEIVLRGPASTPLVVKLPGPVNIPLLVQDVVLEPDAGPREIVVAVGATVRGMLTPADVVESFGPPEHVRREAARPGADAAGLLARYAPGIQFLKSLRGGESYPVHTYDWFPVAADGSFEVRGVPPGTWEVCLGHRTFPTDGAVGHASHRLATVENLTEGEVRELTLDAGTLIPGELRGRILINGVPAAGADVVVTSRPDRDARRENVFVERATDGEGRFSVDLQAGTYLVHLRPRREGATQFSVTSPDVVEVDGRRVTERDFHFESRALELRILDGEGHPVARREVTVSDDQTFLAQFVTDADGRFVLDPSPRQAFHVRTWPAHLDTPAERDALLRAGKFQEVQQVDAGPFEPPPGQAPAKLEVRL